MTWPQPGSAPGRILAAVDFDEMAGAVLQHAYAAASTEEAPLSVLHVVDAGTGDTAAPEARLRAIVDHELPRQPMPQLLVASGRPETAIADVAAETGVDLIVLGTHGRGAIARWTLGSVATDVVRLTACPVLCVQTPLTPHAGGPVVAAVDLGGLSAVVARTAARTAAISGAALRLLHVIPGGSRGQPDNVRTRDAALTCLRELRAYGVPADIDVEVDAAVLRGPESRAVAIAQDAEASDAPLIVVGAHGASGQHIGDVTAGVLHETARPVLMVHPSEVEGAGRGAGA